MMENMDPSIGEYFKLKNWVDTFMRIPFNKFNNLSFTMDPMVLKNVMNIWNNQLRYWIKQYMD